MSDLRAMLGDRYQATIQAALLADKPGLIEDAKRIGGKLGQLMYLANVDRMHRTLTAVLNADMGDYEHPDDGSWHTNPYRKENDRG